MSQFRLEVDHLARSFGPRRVLRDVSFALESRQSLAVVGRNGSGKTTLLLILAGLAPPSRGMIKFAQAGRLLDRAGRRRETSYVGPELALYDNLTAHENLKFFSIMRGLPSERQDREKMLEGVQLSGRGDDFYGTYSSGMKLRLKYAVALIGEPALLLLDEPTSNLDDDGKRLVEEIIVAQKERGMIIIATNEKEEYRFAGQIYRVDD